MGHTTHPIAKPAKGLVFPHASPFRPAPEILAEAPSVPIPANLAPSSLLTANT